MMSIDEVIEKERNELKNIDNINDLKYKRQIIRWLEELSEYFKIQEKYLDINLGFRNGNNDSSNIVKIERMSNFDYDFDGAGLKCWNIDYNKEYGYYLKCDVSKNNKHDTKYAYICLDKPIEDGSLYAKLENGKIEKFTISE